MNTSKVSGREIGVDPGHFAAVATAWAASDFASQLAASASALALHSEVAVDDALEAARAAWRARRAAGEAERNHNPEDAWAAAREAWAAAGTAREANNRANAAVAEGIVCEASAPVRIPRA